MNMSNTEQKNIPPEKQDETSEYRPYQASKLITELLAKTVDKQKTRSQKDAARALEQIKIDAQTEISRINVNAKENIKTYVDMMAEIKADTKRSADEQKAKVEKDAKEAIAVARAEADEKIAMIRAEAEKVAEEYADMVARVKTEAKETVKTQKAEVDYAYSRVEKIKAQAEEKVNKIKVEAEGKERGFEIKIAAVKAQAEDLVNEQKARSKTKIDEAYKRIERIKADAEEEISELKADNEARAKKFANEVARIKADAKEYVEKHRAGSKAEVDEAYERIKLFRLETEEKIIRVKARAEEKVQESVDRIVRIQNEAKVALEKQKTKLKAEVAEAYKKAGQAGLEADGKTEAMKELVSGLKSEAERKVKTLEEQIARLKAEAKETAKAISEQIIEAKVNTKKDTSVKVDSQEKPISTIIQKMAQSMQVSPTEQDLTNIESPGSGLLKEGLSSLYAKDVMQKELVWASPEDSVKQTLDKMKKHKANYVMVGQDGIVKGVVSKADVKSALSPYLHPVFAKWRRPLDNATLQIKLKWIMSKPVQVIKPQVPFLSIVKNMYKSCNLCLPVVDEQGKVAGLITNTSIFKVLLESESDSGISHSDQLQQEKPTRATASTPMQIQIPAHKQDSIEILPEKVNPPSSLHV